MWFEQLIGEETGCAAFMIGSDRGECLVFDPLWDISPYLELAGKKNAIIRRIIDSHTHADPAILAERLDAGAVFLVDARRTAAYGAGHIAGSVNIQLAEGQFEQRPGWVLPDDAVIVIAAGDDRDAAAALAKLAFIGLESWVVGCLPGGIDAWAASGRALETLDPLTPERLADWVRDGTELPILLDVRDEDEWEAGDIAGAVRRGYKELGLENGSEGLMFDRAVPLVVYCAAGNRSSLAGGMLKAAGYRQVDNPSGGLDARVEAGHPPE